MKSIYRCTANHQGDRCKLSRYHVRDNPEQPAHAGNFHLWTEADGVIGQAPGAVPRIKRSRLANRTFRAVVGMARNGDLPTGVSEEAVKNDLMKLEQYFGGKQ